ncbi:class I lanthipeptide [Mucilaginibacter sp. BT774]|uniref:class I lanthipeptide n=1 Tax=Mucilaginibacter sp. BT774 TaxID=3062276 RepID=UPI002675662C|nr:class I lanthipeptide [Mucilaginibacter sp. BT774]MDO3627169.1 class I lanthipeptide [Mucilaginibacter sp. BT774]
MEKKPLKKLALNKSVIAKLTEDEQSMVKGGAAFTTSGNCTGFLCCQGTSNCITYTPDCWPKTSPQNTCETNSGCA